VPTAENLAAEAFRLLDAAYLDTYGNQLRLQRVRLYETPNNWADAVRHGCGPLSEMEPSC
jgi:6-pyruvoyltetrahydropterin/6-carboxytetrahydropterin synthase